MIGAFEIARLLPDPRFDKRCWRAYGISTAELLTTPRRLMRSVELELEGGPVQREAERQ